MAAAGFEMVRYADDFVILCRSADGSRSRRWRMVQHWTDAAGLTLHPDEDADRGCHATRRL